MKHKDIEQGETYKIVNNTYTGHPFPIDTRVTAEDIKLHASFDGVVVRGISKSKETMTCAVHAEELEPIVIIFVVFRTFHDLETHKEMLDTYRVETDAIEAVLTLKEAEDGTGFFNYSYQEKELK